jgi:uncharacterized membrane protein (TIGR02234 family)
MSAASRPDSGTPRPRRLLAYTVGVCLGGAGLALLAVTRVWSVSVTERPGLSELRTARTGAAELPWLPALALVGLAGAGALLATRGWARRAIGVLLVLAGAGLAAGVAAARTGLEPGAAGAAGTFWPGVAVAGAALVVLGGWWAIRHGHRWPAMGARYERPAGAASGAGPDQPRADRPVDTGPVDTRSAWDALDRGDDPTVR